MKYKNRALAELTSATIATLKEVDFPLVMPGSRELLESQKTLLTQLQTRILPQFAAQEFPAIVVFGGSSGTGKSTLVNSLLGEEITAASVIRPTTTRPILAVHPQDQNTIMHHPLAKFADVVLSENAVAGIALVDAPDFDTVNEDNQEISRRLLESADLWIFTTTASRYGDAKAWQTLELANQRGLTCAVVLNRLPQRANLAVREDIRKRLITVNLAGTPLFLVPDHSPMRGLLPDGSVAELKNWLALLAQTKLSELVAERTTDALIPALRNELTIIADGIEAQANALTDLKDKAIEASVSPLEKLTGNVRAGRFGQGAPAASWLALASTGGTLAQMAAAAGKNPNLFQSSQNKRKLRDNAFVTLFDSVAAGVQSALLQALISTRTRIEAEWENDVVTTEKFVKEAHERVNPDSLSKQALKRWKTAVYSLALSCKQNKWLSPAGTAAFIGAAAGGVAGVSKLAVQFGLESDVRQARKILAASAKQAVEMLVGEYLATLDQVHIPDTTALKLRAAEFTNRV
ncbi:GTPase domain-containing protein [Arcanobacterium hippocoleae]